MLPGSLSILLISLPRPAPAAEPVTTNAAERYVFRSWDTQEGLPQNTVNDIVQTRDGYLWLGTREGLARFDGVRFTVLGLGEGLQNIEVQTLFEDRKGSLWVGTSGGGLGRLEEGRIVNVPMPQRSQAGDIVTSLAEDAEGRLWVGTRAGLRIYRDDRFVASPALTNLARASILALAFDEEGAMWIATANRGLYRFQGGRLALQTGPATRERITAYCLLADQHQRLWASIGNGTVLCRQEGQWHAYTETNGLPFAYIACLAEEADGTIWAGSLDEGLYRFDHGQFHSIRQSDGLAANDIRSLCPDREGNLWVGTRTRGISRLSRRKLISYGAAQGLTNDFTRSVAQSADGTLWVGTIGGGLYHGVDGTFLPTAEEMPGLRYAFVQSVLAVGSNTVWYGANRGLFRLENGTLTGRYTNETWLGSAAVTALCDDRQGGIWIGTSASRLVHFENGRFVEFSHRVARGPVTALVQQPDGFLWVGSEAGGLKRIHPGSEAILAITNGLLSQAIRTLRLDPDRSLWIGTAGGGLGLWRDHQVFNFTTRQGLEADTVSQILEDDDGNLWLGGSLGIQRVRRSELENLIAGGEGMLSPLAFGLNEGMPAEECSSGFCPAGLKMSNGTLCFSTVKGLLLLDPRKVETNAPPPVVMLEEVEVNGAPAKIETPDAGRSPESPPARLSIPPGGREMEIHYTAISFAAPEKLRFRYRLKGVDKGWSEAGDRRSANYHALPPGEFEFQVMACSANSRWSEPVTALNVTVEPLLWEEGWFRAVVGLISFGLLAGTVRLVERKRYRRRLVRLEMQHAVERERLRISQDMHDHVGSILTQVSLLSDLGQSESGGSDIFRDHFQKIGGQARAAVQALDEIVWATNPRNDNLRRFAEYICRFADECFESTTIRCWQEVPTQLPELPLRADVRHNAFLAIREALTNILKHAGATEVSLRLDLDETRVKVAVHDNGRGFNPAELARPGNGLENMKARMAECGGRAGLKSTPGEGTVVRFSFPLPKMPGAG